MAHVPPTCHGARAAAHARGISLVEVMVGLVIGLIAVAVIMQVFSTAEAFKRNTTSAGDAQQNGLFSTFTLALELANAGNGIGIPTVFGSTSLAKCPNTNDVATILRPIPVIITAGKDASSPDAFVVTYSVASKVVYPAQFVASAAPGAPYRVQSPNGFARDDMVIAGDELGQCERTKVTDVSVPDPDTGVVTIAHTGGTLDLVESPFLINLGAWNRAQRVRYDVDAAAGTLRSQNLFDPNAPVQPLASNVVNMKVQYGIDTNGDGFLDTWVAADAAPWRPQDLMAANLPEPSYFRIKAVRIGFVVRSAQFDRNLTTATTWKLFDCDHADKATCPGYLEGSIAPDPSGGGYRYRTYETVVPLRNQIWNHS